MRYGEMTAFEERPHSPYYGSRRRHAALRGAARRVRALDRRPPARARARARGPRGAELDRRVRRPAGQRVHLRTSAATRRPASRTSAGRTPGTRSPTATAACRASRGRPASCRATPTTRRCAAPGWPGSSGRTRRSPTSSSGEAADLKRRFNRDFWVEDGEYFALALDADGSQVDSLTSNIGHLLWSGIVDKSKAKAVARAPARADGSSPAGACARWPRARGATTRSATTSARSGRSTTRSSPGACAATASRRRRPGSPPGILDAAEFFDGRLPEAFGGYERGVTKYPVQYPTACSPQAWSTGAPLLLLRTMLGLEPIGDHLVVDPALPGRASGTSSCSTSRAAGAASTPSPGGGLLEALRPRSGSPARTR